jgi:hypothetical protein
MNTLTMHKKKPAIFIGLGATLFLAGCDCKCECCDTGGVDADIVYAWDIPQSQADCPENTIYMDSVPGGPDLDGMPGIVDRDGGPSIVDRDGDYVTQYCLIPCDEGQTTSGPVVIEFHHPGGHIVASRRCEDP